jgi:REP element-mobilizing transposase RayT
MKYFITFACYGAHLHGESGSVDRDHNVPGNRYAPPSGARIEMKRRQMDQQLYELDGSRRAIVLAAIREGCLHRNWKLWAVHVRTNHVHVIVEAGVRPEIVMNALKAYASRDLNTARLDPPDRRRWSRHGSTRWLFTDQAARDAIRYVIDDQGEPMEIYLADPV